MYSGAERDDTYAFHAGGRMTRVEAMASALRAAVGALWKRHPGRWRVCSHRAADPAPLVASAGTSLGPFTVAVASGNQQKVDAARAAVATALGVPLDAIAARGVSVESGVPGQPVGDETPTGARNRLAAIRDRDSEPDAPTSLFVAVENGVVPCDGTWVDVALVVVANAAGESASARSLGVPVPYDGDMAA